MFVTFVSTVIATFLIWNTVAMAMTILRLHRSANTYVAISTPGKLPSIVKSFTCNKRLVAWGQTRASWEVLKMAFIFGWVIGTFQIWHRTVCFVNNGNGTDILTDQAALVFGELPPLFESTSTDMFLMSVEYIVHIMPTQCTIDRMVIHLFQNFALCNFHWGFRAVLFFH